MNYVSGGEQSRVTFASHAHRHSLIIQQSSLKSKRHQEIKRMWQFCTAKDTFFFIDAKLSQLIETLFIFFSRLP